MKREFYKIAKGQKITIEGYVALRAERNSMVYRIDCLINGRKLAFAYGYFVGNNKQKDYMLTSFKKDILLNLGLKKQTEIK